MPIVFLSYRHETKEHAEKVLNLALRLENAGLTVILDVLAQKRHFRDGGPDEGWNRWSKAQAENEEHKVLIIASPGWFLCYKGKEKPGSGLGSSAEARVIGARIDGDSGINRDIRIVDFNQTTQRAIPLDLRDYHLFTYPEEFHELVHWLTGIEVTSPPQTTISTASHAATEQSTPSPQTRFEWKRIEGGSFSSGYDRDRLDQVLAQFGARSAGGDAERVNLPTFWIGKYPVTNAQYTSTIGGHAGTGPSKWNSPLGKEHHPVVGLTWSEAKKFAERLGGDLPSKHEWEKAARGDADTRLYPWGETFDPTRCACIEAGARDTSAVGSHPSGDSPYGVADLVGNVSEWVANREGNHCGYRGGSFKEQCEIEGMIHDVGLTWVKEGQTSDDRGFRLVSHVNPRQFPHGMHIVV
jgi:formylglycine-generating enzyme required for sulfatase activity